MQSTKSGLNILLHSRYIPVKFLELFRNNFSEHLSEPPTGGVELQSMVFLKLSQHLLENTCIRVSFLIKL